MKYQKRPEIALELGKILARQQDVLPSGSLIPVPQTKTKIRKRGYNQSALLALGISSVSGVKVETNFLHRFAHKHSQTKMNRQMRFENMVDALYINRKSVVCEPVWLVDDVLTTGATLNACLHALTEAGIDRIGVFVLASA